MIIFSFNPFKKQFIDKETEAQGDKKFAQGDTGITE